jgi:hypothetical protein
MARTKFSEPAPARHPQSGAKSDRRSHANVLLVPIVAGLAPDELARLWLRTSFQVRLDDSREHLAVVRSVFALVIDEGSKRPAVRVEYDRDQANEPDDVAPASVMSR